MPYQVVRNVDTLHAFQLWRYELYAFIPDSWHLSKPIVLPKRILALTSH